VDVIQVDARDDDVLRRWHAVWTASALDLRPDDVTSPLVEVRAGALAGLPERDPTELVELVLAVDGGEPVGAARLELPLRDNTHLAFLEGGVAPSARRRGAGTALLAALAARAGGGGRTLLMAELDEPPGLPSPGRAFLEHAGFACGLVELRRDLALPVPEERLAALEARACEAAADYEVVTWRDRCPDELVEGRAALGRAMSTDVPLGELDYGEEAWDAARVREREGIVAAQGRTSVVAAARHRPSGALVAFTELAARVAQPADVHQWETLVLREHRGHRLGLLVKAAALRRLAAEVPGARRVLTVNATTNGPMVAVNEALGFVRNGAVSTWQRAV
jgi:GNAT superfamily N-acetyltransferase